MHVNEITKSKSVFPAIHTEILDRLAEQAEELATLKKPEPRPVIKRWPRLFVW